MKFKIGFTIEGETLFRMLSKFLPVDDLQVEELAPSAPAAPAPALPHDWTPGWSKQIAKPVRKKPKPYKRRPSKPMDLKSGINRVIMAALADGYPHRAAELGPLLVSNGFAANSVSSRLQSLEQHGIVKRIGDGTWTLGNATAQSTTTQSA